MADRRELEQALVELTQAAQAGDERAADAARAIAAELEGSGAVGSSTLPKAAAPAGAAGAPARGSGKRNPGFDRAIEYGAVAGMAPVKAATGLVDLGMMAGAAADKKLGLLDENFEPPYLTPQLSTEGVKRSIPLAMVEGAIGGAAAGMRGPLSKRIMAPLSPGATAVNAATGAAGSGAGEAVAEAGGGPGARILASIAAALATGKIADASRLGRDWLAHSRVAGSVRGVSNEELAKAQELAALAKKMGVELFPSQTLKEGSGLARLQNTLFSSRSKSADPFISLARNQPDKVKALVESLRNVGGQAPRMDDDLAQGVQDIAAKLMKAEGDAVNAATKPLYNAPDAKKVLTPTYTAYRQKQLNNMLDEALVQHRTEPAVVLKALSDAKDKINAAMASTGRKPMTAGEFSEMLQKIKRSLPAYTEASPSDANRARQVVTSTLEWMTERADELAPSVTKARQVQADLRSGLSNEFDDLSRVAEGSGRAAGFVDNAAKSGRVLGAVAGENPRLAQELVQRRVNQAVGKAAGSSAPGEALAKALDDAPGLEYLGDPAQQTLRDALLVAKAGGRPSGFPGAGDPRFRPYVAASESRDAARAAQGQLGNVAALMGRVLSAAGLHVSDASVIRVLSRPDAMQRISELRNISPASISAATLLTLFPELKEPQK